MRHRADDVLVHQVLAEPVDVLAQFLNCEKLVLRDPPQFPPNRRSPPGPGPGSFSGSVDEYWMPFLTGLVFVPPLLVSVWMLSRIPPPREEDVRRRSRRSPMLRADRRRFFALAIGGFAQGWLSDMGFMVLTGVGMYVPYVAFHTTLFERMIAVFRDKSNIGYLMYLADAVGYLGYVGVVPFRSFSQPSPRYLDFFFRSSLLICAVSIILMVLCFLYFRQRIASLGPADGRATRGLAAAAVPPSSGN